MEVQVLSSAPPFNQGTSQNLLSLLIKLQKQIYIFIPAKASYRFQKCWKFSGKQGANGLPLAEGGKYLFSCIVILFKIERLLVCLKAL